MKSDFEKESPRWQRSLILVCEKCGKKMGEPELAQDLKNEWKKEFQREGLWGESRIVVSTCLDICPKDEMAVARVTDEKTAYTFPRKRAGEFFEFLKDVERRDRG